MQETCELKRKREKVNFSGLLTSVVHWSIYHWSLHRVSIASPGNVVQGMGPGDGALSCKIPFGVRLQQGL